MDGLFAPTGWLVQGVILATGVIGQLYVARMNLRGFYYWIVSNIILIAVCLQVGGYGMGALYVYFLFMAIYSISHWEERQAQERKRQAQQIELLVIAKAFVELAATHETAGADYAYQLDQAQRILLAEGVMAAPGVKHEQQAACLDDTIVAARTACACGQG